ncbi:MAG: ATP-binding protein, partial [Candidatus Omnitrophota bacterium]
DVALVGGGSIPKPGEVTLSHNGVLFLDELPEFNRNVLEALRQPLEDSYVTVSRASKSMRFPAKFMLIASMNPCPCGYYTDPKKECHCTPNQIQRYLAKISGPLLDRIDIHLEVPSLKSFELLASSPVKNESSSDIKLRTMKARLIQQKRFQQEAAEDGPLPQGPDPARPENTLTYANAQMNHRQIKKYCSLSAEGKGLLKKAIEEIGLSARAYDKILKVSRTIADLEGTEQIQTEHLAEAIQYRSLDRGFFG